MSLRLSFQKLTTEFTENTEGISQKFRNFEPDPLRLSTPAIAAIFRTRYL